MSGSKILGNCTLYSGSVFDQQNSLLGLVAKVQVFFEGQNFFKESATLESNLIQENMHGIFFSKFVAFSEYPNFTIRLALQDDWPNLALLDMGL